MSKLSDTWRTATNTKRARGGGGFGGISNLEKKRHYRAMDSGGRRSHGYGMVFDKDEIRRGRGDEDDTYEPSRKRYSRSRSPKRYDRQERGRVSQGARDDRRRSRSRDYYDLGGRDADRRRR